MKGYLMSGNMNPIVSSAPMWDSFYTFSRSNVANYQSTTSITEDSAIELLKNSIFFIEFNSLESDIMEKLTRKY
jgi:hypothetical protein